MTAQHKFMNNNFNFIKLNSNKKVLIYLMIVLFVTLFGEENFADENRHNRITPTVRAVAKVMPSVVNLSTEKVVTKTYSPWGGDRERDTFFRDIFKGSSIFKRKEPAYSLGSGCIIDSSGLIVTNAHVVYRATKINVILSNGKTFSAREIASADLNDIALLRINNLPTVLKLQPIEFARPGDLYLGETTIAVGNPYGLGNSISKGVLSAISRQAVHEGKVVLRDILQTDAAINPGNSGGPLININGKMIGINVANHKLGKGIGFAIPLRRVENLLAKWLIPERFGNYSLGIIPASRSNADNSRQEVYIADVMKGSPAWDVGIRKGAVIRKVNAKSIDALIDLSRILWRQVAGDKISFVMADDNIYDVKVEELQLTDGKALAMIRLGLGVQELTSQLAAAMNYPFDRGVVVSKNLTGDNKIKRGDVIARLEDFPIYNFTDIARVLRGKRFGDKIETVLVSVFQKDKKYYLLKKIVELKVK